MNIDTIKISQEINFNGMPTWISIGGTLLPDDDVKDGLRQLQKSITEYQQEEQVAYGQSKWKKAAPESNPAGNMINSINSCTEIKVLESYKIMAKSNPILQAAYEEKLKELEK